VLVSSHVLGDIERTCDWVLMLDGGRVLRSGPLSHLVDADVVAVDVIGDSSVVAHHLIAAGAVVDANGSRLLVSTTTDDPFRLVRDALAETGAGMRSMGPKATTLEDVFLEGSES